MSKIEYLKVKCEDCGGTLTKGDNVLVCEYCRREYHYVNSDINEDLSKPAEDSLENAKTKMKKSPWSILQRLFFSPFVLKEKRSRKVAYVAMMVALSIVSNIFFEFKLGTVQYSLTTAVSCLIGVLLGPIAGFVACFIGDAVGFFVNPFGSYTPWIGLATGLMAFISGVVVHFYSGKSKLSLYVKLGVIAGLTFAVCSIGINSTFLWMVWYNESPYHVFLITRYFVQGQVFVSIVNYAILFILISVIKRVPFFKSLEL